MSSTKDDTFTIKLTAHCSQYTNWQLVSIATASRLTDGQAELV